MNWLTIAVAPAALALAIDRAWGEPPAWAHPVIAMGRWLGWAGRPWPDASPALALLGGGLAWAVGAALSTGLAAWIEQALRRGLGHSLGGLLLLPWPAAWPGLRRQARLTPSPNGGWPMGAMALRLGVGVGLGKPGVYRLGADGRDATAADTGRAAHLAGRALAAATLLLAGLAGLIAGLRLAP